MQQTAVEWLAEQLKKQGFLYDLDIEAAKQMEKENMKFAWQDGNNTIPVSDEDIEICFNDYYNKVYKQKTPGKNAN